MRGWSGPSGLLLTSAATVAVVVGSIIVPQMLRSRAADAPAMYASVADELTVVPELWDLTGEGHQAPPGDMAGAPAPDPAGAPAAPGVAAAGRAPTPLVVTRIPKPVVPAGPRRVGIQAGHWQTEKAPPELGRILTQTGTSWNGITEVEINLDIAERVKRIIEPHGIAVDILPTTVPPGYIADAFVALHGDGDGTGVNSGFKMAFGARRTPYEAALMESIKAHYGAATGLRYDQFRISRNMTGYFAFSWQRIRYATAPHTPSVILEMGYVSNDDDRALMVERADVVASGIAEGILRFLETHPRERLFGQDLIVPATQFRFPTPTPGT